MNIYQPRMMPPDVYPTEIFPPDDCYGEELQKVKGTEAARQEFWFKQQKLAAECGVEIEEAD